jgi:hypothetical protein
MLTVALIVSTVAAAAAVLAARSAAASARAARAGAAPAEREPDAPDGDDDALDAREDLAGAFSLTHEGFVGHLVNRGPDTALLERVTVHHPVRDLTVTFEEEPVLGCDQLMRLAFEWPEEDHTCAPDEALPIEVTYRSAERGFRACSHLLLRRAAAGRPWISEHLRTHRFNRT